MHKIPSLTTGLRLTIASSFSRLAIDPTHYRYLAVFYFILQNWVTASVLPEGPAKTRNPVRLSEFSLWDEWDWVSFLYEIIYTQWDVIPKERWHWWYWPLVRGWRGRSGLRDADRGGRWYRASSPGYKPHDAVRCRASPSPTPGFPNSDALSNMARTRSSQVRFRETNVCLLGFHILATSG